MTTSTLTGSTGLCRCAVCKIDLRGRFVVVDSQTEKLLGYAREDLFGKSVLDYLDSPSKALIEQILAVRNHYESHYDYAPLTLLSKSGHATEVDATISLCYNGGNPVNYLLILKEQSRPIRSPDEVVGGLTIEEFVERGLALEPASRLSSLPRLLCQYSLAEQVVIYLITEGKLEPLAGAQAGSSEPLSFDAITEPTELHHRVAQTGEEYTWSVKDSADPPETEHPPEFDSKVAIEGRTCLLRFVFSENMPVDIRPQMAARARLAGQLAGQLFNSASAPSEDSDPGIDMKFTIGFLSALGIGALVTDSDGKIVGYNPALVEILDELTPGETSRDFVKLLAGDDSAGWAALIHEQLQDSDSADMRVNLSLPSGENYLLAIIRFADEAGDQTACWALIPRSDTTAGDSEVSFETTVWSSLVDGMKPALDEIACGAEELRRDYCSQVKHLDDSGLNRLHEAVRTMRQMLADSSLLHTLNKSSPVVVVSMNDLVDEAAEAVRGEFPDVTIKCEHTRLPSIKTSPVRLAAVLRNLMANCVRHNQNPNVTFTVSAATSHGRCRIVVSDDGAGMPRREFRRLFDLYLPPTTTGIPRRSGGAGLGLSRLLVQDLGGKIQGASKEGVGTRLAVMLPQSTQGAE
jgi:PAS domain S-box-containing protein